MKRFKKKILMTMLMATLLCSNMTYAKDLSVDENEAINRCIASGIMTGTDKGYEEDKTLTRAEAATILTRFKGITVGKYDSCNFIDVPKEHWAYDYINACYNFELIKGVSENEFAPDKEVTVAEFTTMIVRALGAGILVDSQGEWPVNYMNFANENNLVDNVYKLYTNNASRLDASFIISNSLEKPLWTKSKVTTNSVVSYEQDTNKNILKDVLKLSKGSLVVKSIDYKDKTVSSKNKTFNVKDTFDLNTLNIGVKYNYFVTENEKEITNLWINEDTLLFYGLDDKYNSSKNSIKLITEINYEDDDKNVVKDYKVAEDAKYYINEDEIDLICSLTTYNKDFENYFGSVVLNDKNEITSMHVTIYDHYGCIDEITSSKITFKKDVFVSTDPLYVAQSNLNINNKDVTYVFIKNGKKVDKNKLVSGDNIAYYITSDSKKVVIEVLDNTKVLTGKVSSMEGSNPSRYFKLKFEDGKQVKIDGDPNLVNTIELSNTITCLLNNSHKLAMYYKSEDTRDALAYATWLCKLNGKYGPEYGIKLFLTDNTYTDELTIDLEDTAENYIRENGGDFSFEGTDSQTYHILMADSSSDKEDKMIKYFDTLKSEYTVGGKWTGFAVNADINEKDNTVELTPLVIYEDDISDCNKYSITNTIKAAYADDLVMMKQKFISYIYSEDEINDSFYLNDKTKIFKVQSKDNDECKVKTIELNNIDEIEDGFEAYIYNIDHKTYDASVLFLLSNSKIKSDTNNSFAIVTEVASIVYKDDKDALEVVVIDINDQKEHTYIYCEDELDGNEFSINMLDVLDLVVGKDDDGNVFIRDLVEHDDEIYYEDNINYYKKDTDFEELYLSNLFNMRMVTVDESSTSETWFLNDKMIVLEEYEDEYIVRTLDDIKLYDDTTSDNDEILLVVTYNDDKEEDVIAVIYKVND